MEDKGLPDGWEYDGFVMASHPDEGTVQVAAAHRTFLWDGSSFLRVSAYARSQDALASSADLAERTFRRSDEGSANVLLPRRELLVLLSELDHLRRQVKDLQQNSTLKEEQLRAHRRLRLTEDQSEALRKDLEETTNSVLAKYAPAK